MHRDLKPENVFVTRDGRVKILDFGLARQALAPARASERQRLSHRGPGRPSPGTVIGTVGYMSPEQVRGRPVDHRSDIFSLGCGALRDGSPARAAFKRETAAETMTAILREDPLELPSRRAARAGSRRRWSASLRHCLEKAPEERFQSARDLAFDLERAVGLDAGAGASAARRAPRRSAWRRSRRRAAALALIGAGLRARAARALQRAERAAPRAELHRSSRSRPAALEPAERLAGRPVVRVREARTAATSTSTCSASAARTPINLTADSPNDDTEPGLLARRHADRLPLRARRRRPLPDGRDRRVGAATDRRRLRPAWSPDGREVVYSTERARDVLALRARRQGELWVVTSRRARSGGSSPEGTGRGAAELVAARAADRVLGDARRRGSATSGRYRAPASAASVVAVTDDSDSRLEPGLVTRRPLSCTSRATAAAPSASGEIELDEASGRASGPPEPLPVPFPTAGYLSFTRDGRRLLLAGAFGTDTIERLGVRSPRGPR